MQAEFPELRKQDWGQHMWARGCLLVGAGTTGMGVTNERVVRKGVAIHLESESCECGRKAALEALTGAYAGRVLSSEILNPEADGVRSTGRPRGGARKASVSQSGGVEYPRHA